MKHVFSDDEKLRKMDSSSLAHNTFDCAEQSNSDLCDPLNERIRKILNIVNQKEKAIANMLFFVMYDISSNKVRTLIAKYLIGKGCTRIQCSIFLADLPAPDYDQIKKDLAEVQAVYENNDSILIVPISEGYLNAMKIIGQSVDIDFITHKDNTIFF